MITKMLKVQIFRGITLVYIAADIICFFITRVVFRNILLIVRLTYPIEHFLLVPMCKFIRIIMIIRLSPLINSFNYQRTYR